MDKSQKNDRESELKLLEKTFDRLWPICRSITGNGLRRSLDILGELIPLKQHEVPSGTQAFDWQVPLEWNIQDAYLITPNGDKIANFKSNNLHVVNYSTSIHKELEYKELLPHLHYIEALPNAIPYRTSYYSENWGFCITKNQFDKLPKQGRYTAYINSSHSQGSLTYGDIVLPGKSKEEILITSYLCHPSLANNELSGPLVLAGLYQRLIKNKNRRYTYRFVVAPETIGSIVYLSKHGKYLKKNLKAGFVVTCAGDSGNFTYKRTRKGNSYPDRVVEYVLNNTTQDSKIVDFVPMGSDERQYCSPGFDLPVGSLMRTMYGEYIEYHTSLDNKEFISFSSLQDTINMYEKIIETMENDICYLSTQPYCEPQLGKRGLYRSLGGGSPEEEQKSMLWILNYSDSNHSLLDIAELSGLSFPLLVWAASKLVESRLLDS